MTDEEKQIKIAELCGLFRLRPLRRETRKGNESPDGVVLRYCSEHHGGAATYSLLPDYLNDLNAMHEAEKKLDSSGSYSKRDYYASILGELTSNDNGRGWEPLCNDDCFPIAHATARQRAEAFLRTLT